MDPRTEKRCSGCGKVIEPKEQCVRVAIGTIVSSEFREKKEWGIMHLRCFNLAIDSPDAVLDEIARIRKERKKTTG